ncbi:GNAT family N-acetyltransferase [Paenibacillus flagellatus]|uniref:GNAT family N-acetyltransferase n=1 Tax=Paenibacillus flagellatus TaxID=2211139 RepID=A0A2V5K4M1_9BACL|nr:GNAT family N-acetyltransferase [Paenibacillus flagellatus]PYI54249.1 GNAT family N-acetyltransferase [Paenibacillus flagellatus]
MVSIKLATPDDSAEVAALVRRLMDEISERTGSAAFRLQEPESKCRRYLENGIYTVLLAKTADGRTIGFLSLCESHSLYADGPFGIIQELYLLPEHRSSGNGSALLDEAVAVARDRGWGRLEVCTPPLPAFDRTFAFYGRNGFDIAGGRKMKRLL